MIKCFTHEIDHSSKFNCQDSKSKSWICCDLKCAQKEVNHHLYMLHILILFSKEKGLVDHNNSWLLPQEERLLFRTKKYIYYYCKSTSKEKKKYMSNYFEHWLQIIEPTFPIMTLNHRSNYHLHSVRSQWLWRTTLPNCSLLSHWLEPRITLF